MNLRTAVLVLCAIMSVASAADKLNWERATVISQEVNSAPAGIYAAPAGNARVAVPIYSRSNRVVVETETQRLEWIETGKNFVILPVNGAIQFYRDGNWFVVIDSKKKKHKFGLVGMVQRSPR